MATALFQKAREGFLDGTLDWDTNTFTITLLDLATADVGIKFVTGATNATPIVITSASHGFTNGDTVSIQGIVGNISANGRFKIANVTANTFELTDPITGSNITGSGAYTSGGVIVNLGPSASGDNWDDFDASLVGTGVNLTSPTVTEGVADAADPTFTSVSGANPIKAIMIRKNTGTSSTDRMVHFYDGRQVVTISANATAGATTLYVERLTGGIPNGTVIGFSNGVLVTLSAAANAGDRSLTVSAIPSGVSAGNRGEAPMTGSNLPITPNGGNITVAFDNGANKIFAL